MGGRRAGFVVGYFLLVECLVMIVGLWLSQLFGGNLVRRAEEMKGLRITHNKSLPSDLVEKSELTDLAVNG